MDASDQRVRLADDHGGRQDLLTAKPIELPDASKSEGFKILSPKAKWLLPIISLLPLIKSGSGDEAPTFCEPLAEKRKLVYGFSSRIDVWNFWLLFHPKRKETPPGHDKLSRTVARVDAHNRDLVSRRDIKPGRKVRARDTNRPKQCAIRIARDEIVIATAHDQEISTRSSV